MPDGIVSDRERFISGERYIMYSAPTVERMMFASYSAGVAVFEITDAEKALASGLLIEIKKYFSREFLPLLCI